MSIDFNKALVFDPKIEIVGEEVPLAAMEKTGAVLQDRFDKAYEQYSLADEALKQMEASANPIDRDKAKELRSLYSQEMQGILQKGDFHNMRHQVSALARNAAANYKTIAERNQIIQQQLDAISKDPRYRLDPEGAKQDFLKSTQSVNINPETRTISDFNVGAYNAAADVGIAEKMLQIAPSLRPKMFKGKGSSFGSRMVNGQKVITVETEGGGYRILKPQEIASELKEYIATDAEVQAYLKRDVKRLGIDPNSEEGQLAYNKLFNERANSAANALGKMYEINEDQRQSTFSVVGGLGSGPKPKRIGVPVNTVADSYGVTNTSLRQNLVGALSGEKGNYHYMLNFLNQKIKDKNLRPTEKLEYSNVKKGLMDAEKLKPEEKQELADLFQLNIGDALEALDDKPRMMSNNVKNVYQQLKNYIGTTLTPDSPFEKEFTNYAKQNQAFQNVNLVVPSYQDATTISNIDTWMKKSLSNNDFKPFKGEIDPKADYTLSKVSDRPIGNGTGVVLELKNTKDNSTILVEPKDARMLLPLNETFPGIVAANQFKNTRDFNNGESRSILEIYNQNQVDMPKNYPDYLKNGKITYNNGMFYLTDNKGNLLGDENGNPIMSTSYIDIIDL